MYFHCSVSPSVHRRNITWNTNFHMLYIDNPVSCFFQTCPLWNQGCINPSSGRPVQAHKGYLIFFSLWCVSVFLVTGGNWIQFHWECLRALDQWEWGRYKPLLSPDPVFHCFLRLPEKWFLHHRRGRWVGYELCLGLYIWYVLSMLQWVYTIIETVPSICTGLVVSCLHAHIHTHTCTHLHARTFACTYTHTHTHTHTQSYAGKYVPAIGYKIHVENMEQPKIFINLKGIAIGDGLCDPVNVRSLNHKILLAWFNAWWKYWKFLLFGLEAIPQNSAPSKISRYTIFNQP